MKLRGLRIVAYLGEGTRVEVQGQKYKDGDTMAKVEISYRYFKV
jgi:hypothetical protein